MMNTEFFDAFTYFHRVSGALPENSYLFMAVLKSKSSALRKYSVGKTWMKFHC